MSEFGTILRHWRQTRRVSQMELGLQADVSARHISFLETGRANPSRQMVVALADILDVPLAERNVMMQSAGFANVHSQFDLNAESMQPIRDALQFILVNHEPFPASVLSKDWRLLMSNQTHHKMFARVRAQQPDFPDTDNIVELLFDPNGLKPFVENWEQVASLFLQRLRREKLIYQQDKSGLLERVLTIPGIPESWKSFHLDTQSPPMVSLILNIGGQRLSMFSALSAFGTAIDITTNELVIEQFFPTDLETAEFFHKLSGKKTSQPPENRQH